VFDQGDDRAVDRRQVRGLGVLALVEPPVDLCDGQVAPDRLEHGQHRDPRRHPPQPVGVVQLADPLGEGRIQRRWLKRQLPVQYRADSTNRTCEKLATSFANHSHHTRAGATLRAGSDLR
jgi:hypothetical protein